MDAICKNLLHNTAKFITYCAQEMYDKMWWLNIKWSITTQLSEKLLHFFIKQRYGIIWCYTSVSIPSQQLKQDIFLSQILSYNPGHGRKCCLQIMFSPKNTQHKMFFFEIWCNRLNSCFRHLIAADWKCSKILLVWMNFVLNACRCCLGRCNWLVKSKILFRFLSNYEKDFVWRTSVKHLCTVCTFLQSLRWIYALLVP